MYVSLYKDLGGLSGACLAGSAELVGQAREWRQRHGGTLFAMWPYAASALTGLRDRLPRMAQYRDHALAIADALHDLEGVRVVPDPPHTSMMHVHLRIGADQLQQAVLGLAREKSVWTWRRSAPGPTPDWRVVELVVGDATLDFEPGEVGSIVQRLSGVASSGQR